MCGSWRGWCRAITRTSVTSIQCCQLLQGTLGLGPWRAFPTRLHPAHHASNRMRTAAFGPMLAAAPAVLLLAARRRTQLRYALLP